MANIAFASGVDIMVSSFLIIHSNEMSTLAHKTIYIDVFTSKDEPILSELKDHHVALTQMETSLASIHNSLRIVRSPELPFKY